ncbi:FAD:protein FMN transferase [Alkalimonas delamerensis]|uniref:FAD:protein FMN transferase n=1 Tax=Alkalimonas delamerensis TaxID=265981 RepID=A0ABT9GLJ5_9GAMM|nr:FAD:protein FMN transferase [Alkalimonas delamerensis]MDP4527837.1 FAD:protein FMN transferase [Alkalimonas delamerensis]
MLKVHYKVWLALLGLAIFVSCSPVQQERLVPERMHGQTMGTYYVVSIFAGEQSVDLAALQTEIDAELELVNQLMSTYIPQSELMRFNSWHSTQPFLLSEPTAEVIAESIRIGLATGGLLDVTIRPLVELWGFGAQGRITQSPSTEQYQAVLPYIGIDKLTLDGLWLSKADPRVSVDLSTIAKGYGVDRVADLLDTKGFDAYLVEVGGEIRARGPKPDGSPWRIAIEQPDAAGRAVQRIIEPGDMALATSGDYRNYFEEDGVRLSHILDPRTGRPIQSRVVSSTVIHPSCMTADGYSTALMIMDAEEALQFANRHGIAALLIVRTEQGYDELVSDAFQPYLETGGSAQ